jgi:hypothetical protein
MKRTPFLRRALGRYGCNPSILCRSSVIQQLYKNASGGAGDSHYAQVSGVNRQRMGTGPGGAGIQGTKRCGPRGEGRTSNYILYDIFLESAEKALGQGKRSSQTALEQVFTQRMFREKYLRSTTDRAL